MVSEETDILKEVFEAMTPGERAGSGKKTKTLLNVDGIQAFVLTTRQSRLGLSCHQVLRRLIRVRSCE